MPVKYKIYLRENLYAVLKIDLSFPKEQEALADALGIGKQERENLLGQQMTEFLYLLGCSDEA